MWIGNRNNIIGMNGTVFVVVILGVHDSPERQHFFFDSALFHFSSLPQHIVIGGDGLCGVIYYSTLPPPRKFELFAANKLKTRAEKKQHKFK